MTKHTPGPWDFRKGDTLNPDRTFGIVRLLSRDECLQIDGDDSGFGGRTEVIAEVTDGTTAEADARLIAAAPELLEALRKADALLKNASTSMGRERTTLPAGNSQSLATRSEDKVARNLPLAACAIPRTESA